MTVVWAFTGFYISLKIKNLFLDLTLLILLSVFLYAIVGAAFFIFVGLVLLYRLFNSYNLSAAIIFTVSSLLIPYLIGVLCYKDSLDNAYTRLMPFFWKITTIEPDQLTLVWMYILYFTLPMIMALCYIYSLIKSKAANSVTRKSHGLSKNTAVKFKFVLLFAGSPAKIALVLLVLVSVYFFIFDSSLKIIFQIDYYLTNRNWSKVIASVKRFPERNFYVVNALNQALYHQGLLGEDMFDFPQHPYALFFTEKSHISVHWQKISLLMDLGFVNYAEHETAESLEKFGPRPYLLKNIIISALAKRNYASAGVYLNNLSKTVFEHKWADDYIERMKSDPDLENDQTIQLIRKNMVSNNYGYSSLSITDVLISLLQKNPENKMAFEYLMTWYLLNGEIENVVKNFGIINSFGYKKLPKYYQQAYLFHTLALGHKASLCGYKIDPSVLETSRQAIGYFNMLRAGDPKAINVLSEKYGDSYIYYFISYLSMMQK